MILICLIKANKKTIIEIEPYKELEAWENIMLTTTFLKSKSEVLNAKDYDEAQEHVAYTNM